MREYENPASPNLAFVPRQITFSDMKADVYQSGSQDIYLFLPQGHPFSALPQHILDQLQSLQFYKTMELEPNMEAANPATIEADFDIHGYSIYRPDDHFGKAKTPD